MSSLKTPFAEINEALQQKDDAHTAEFENPEWAVTFLMEAGRSGSTLFTQILASCYRIGYISNVLGKFWLAPYYGALLEKELLVDGLRNSGFKSNYGNTKGAYEANEWGWFWQHWLQLEDDEQHIQEVSKINFAGLIEKLAAVEHVKEVPLFIDNTLAVANMATLKQNLPNALAVKVERDPYYVCNSHLNARLSRFGDIYTWYGYRPCNFTELSCIENPVEQVVLQIKATRDELNQELVGFDPGEILTVNYVDLCNDPIAEVLRYKAFLESHSSPTYELKDIELPQFVNRNNPQLVREEFKHDLDKFVGRHFGAEFLAAS
jgi:hypothetical protein